MTDAMNQEQLEQWIRDKEYDCSTDHDLEMVVSVGDLRTLFAGRRLVQADEKCCADERGSTLLCNCRECIDYRTPVAPTEALRPASPDKEVK